MQNTYIVKDSPLGAELEVLENGKIETVNCGDATTSWVENISRGSRGPVFQSH